MTIAEWLKSLSLERYAHAFVENEIAFENLALLSDDDLKEMGLPLGPRRQILSAARELKAADGTAADLVPEPERRHITVLFADMVESTAIASSTDPETVDAIFKAFREVVSGEIVRHNGHIAKFMGDGVMAYFGWPHAREDSGECALRAGLGIVAAVARLQNPGGSALQSRVGIASGLVVIGGLTGSGAAREENIAGDTPHLAARLQSLAGPDQIVIGEGTHRLVGGLFDCESLGEHEVKGFAAPVSVWRVAGEAVESSRFSAVRQLRGDLVGRDRELDQLLRAWERACIGNGRAMLISGEAGIGKSRLVADLRTAADKMPHSYIFWQCSPFHTNSAFYPVIRQIENAAGFEPHDPPTRKLERLEALLLEYEMPLEPTLALVAELLSLPAGRFPSPELTPIQRKATLIATLAEWVAKVAARLPLLIVLEDAHWTDPTTQDLIARLVKLARDTSLLIVVTARPGATLPWIGHAAVEAIALERLGAKECARIIKSLTQQTRLANDVVDTIVARSDGNPLYVEELTLAVAGSAVRDIAAVPDSLQDSLMARLDELSHVRDLAQIASVIGRQFSRTLLASVAAQNDAVIDADLSALVGADIVHAASRVSGLYEFKHALLCDAAYESLTFARRRLLHRTVAERLEAGFPDVVETEPELLAYHFERAELAGKASDYAERAGDRSAARFAYVEAIANYNTAIAQNALGGPDLARSRRELALLLKMGPGLSIIRGAQHGVVAETYQRAATCAETLNDLDALFKAQWGLWYNRTIGRDFDAAVRKADELVALSARTGDDTHVLEAIHCRWSSAFFLGDCRQSISDARRGMTLYNPERHHRLAVTFGGHDPGVCAHAVCANALAMRGEAKEARRETTAALALAKARSHVHSEAHALLNQLTAYPILHDYAAILSCAEQLKALAERYNFPPMLAHAVYCFEWTQGLDGGDKALFRLRESFENVFAIGPQPALYATTFAERLLEHNCTDEALACLDRVKTYQVENRPSGLYASEAARLRGEALVMRGGENSDGAEAAFTLACEIAERQDARLLYLRAAMSAMKISALRDSARTRLAALLPAFADEDANLEELVQARALL